MSESPVHNAADDRPRCRHCGAPAPQWVSTCVQCGRRVMPIVETSNKSARNWEIVYAVFIFGITNLALLATVYPEGFASPPSAAMRLIRDDQWLPHAARVFLLGPPGLAVLWKWYQLMHEPKPDYGCLWTVYLTAQLLTFVAAFAFCAAVAIVAIVAIVFWSVAAPDQ